MRAELFLENPVLSFKYYLVRFKWYDLSRLRHPRRIWNYLYYSTYSAKSKLFFQMICSIIQTKNAVATTHCVREILRLHFVPLRMTGKRHFVPLRMTGKRHFVPLRMTGKRHSVPLRMTGKGSVCHVERSRNILADRRTGILRLHSVPLRMTGKRHRSA